MTPNAWTPGHVILAGFLLFVAAVFTVTLTAVALSREAAILLGALLLCLTIALLAAVVVHWLRAPRHLSPTAAGLFPVLTTNAAGRLVVVNPNTAPGPTTAVRPDGQVDLGGVFDPAHLLAASREGRIVQATAALSQPGALPPEARWNAAAWLAQATAPAEDLPPVRVSAVDPEHVRRLLIEAGELDEQGS
jgi:hypothetical protein